VFSCGSAQPLAGNMISIVMDPARLGERGEPIDGRRIADFKRLCKDLEIRLVLAEREHRDSLRSLIVREANRILQQRGAL
jgi:hypothetical protein